MKREAGRARLERFKQAGAPHGISSGASGRDQGGGELFFYRISADGGMTDAPGMDYSEVVQALNPDRLEAPGYFHFCEPAPGYFMDVDGQKRPAPNRLGWIHVLVHWHGSPPTPVRINVQSGNVTVDQRNQTKFNLNRTRLPARLWAAEHVPGMENNIKRLEGPWHLVEPSEPPLQVDAPRVPKDEEIKRPGRGRPSKAEPPEIVAEMHEPGAVEATAEPSEPPARGRGGPPKADRPQIRLPALPSDGHFDRAGDDARQTWVIKFDKSGRPDMAYQVPVEAALERLDADRGHKTGAESPASLLPVELRDEVLARKVGAEGRTLEEIVWDWSSGTVGPRHVKLLECKTHVRQALHRLRKTGFEYAGSRYTIREERVTETVRDALDGSRRNRSVKKFFVETKA